MNRHPVPDFGLTPPQDWISTADSYVPKRSTKRKSKATSKPTVEQVKEHLAAVENFPVDLSSDQKRLEAAVAAAEEWREKMSDAMEDIKEDAEEQVSE